MALNKAKLTVDELKKMTQSHQLQTKQAKANLAQLRKSAQDMSKAAHAVAELSKKNPEV